MSWLRRQFSFLSSQKPTATDFVCVRECLDCQHQKIPSYLKISDDPMADSVKAYKKHLFTIVNTHPKTWPSHIEELNPVLEKIDAKLTLCAPYPYTGEPEKTVPLSTVDVLEFPGGKVASNVDISQLKEVSLTAAPSETRYIFVCVHARRDKRCGIAGEIILEQLFNVIQQQNLQDKVKLFGCSHLGGHKFAGTMVIYPQGIWYGRVSACHAEQIIQETVLENKIIQDLFRGKVDLEW